MKKGRGMEKEREEMIKTIYSIKAFRPHSGAVGQKKRIITYNKRQQRRRRDYLAVWKMRRRTENASTKKQPGNACATW